MRRITIEKATVKDADEILRIQKGAYLSEAEIYQDFNIPPLVQTLSELKEEFNSHIFYVAKESDEIVGSVSIKIEGNVGTIGRLIVKPTYQGNGIGSQLMGHVETNHSSLKSFELFTGHKSERNLKLYRSLGYREFSSKPVHAGLTFVFMRKIANKHSQQDAANDAAPLL